MIDEPRESGSPPNATRDRRPYQPPSLTVHGRMTDLTETGMGSGKESDMSNKRPVTLSNP
jgi:hypothetical protein